MKRVAMIAFCCWVCFSASSQNRPNIVLIMADDLGYGDIGCYGNTEIKTPNIDALAMSGIRFSDYHSNGAVCSPTRAALMTGRYQQRCGVEGVITAKSHREVGMALSEITIAEVLKAAGYDTAIFGKWHLGYDVKRFGPQLQGFDTFEGFVSGNVDYFFKIDQEGYKDWWVGEKLSDDPNYLTKTIGDRAVKWIGEHKDKPFFLYLPHGAPHGPYQGPGDKGFREVGRIARQPPINAKQKYREVIEALDQSVGEVVAALKEQGVYENTLIIFTSDNGQVGPGSAGPLRGGKAQVYEGGHRVPMIMNWPGNIDAGTESGVLAIGMDFYPTFAKLAGAELPGGLTLDGDDLFDLMREGGDRPGRVLHWLHNESIGTREGYWKLVNHGKGKPQLFNLSEDLGEQKDLADKRPEIVETLMAKQKAWLEETRRGVTPVSIHPQQ